MTPVDSSHPDRWAARTAKWFSLGAFATAFALIAGFAGIGAYVAMALALPVLLLVLWHWRWFGAQDGTFPAFFGLAYAILAVCMVLPGRPEGSAIYIFDFLPLGLAVALYVGLCRFPRETLLSIASHGCLAGTAIALGVGGYQVFALGAARADGIGGSAINYANICLLMGFLTLAPLFSCRTWRWYFLAGPLMGITAALLSGSRSVIPVGVILTAVLGIHLVIWLRSVSSRATAYRAALFAICGLAAVTAAMLLLDSQQVQRITATFAKAASILAGKEVDDASLAIRLDYYRAALEVFLQAPMTGYGWHQAIPVVEPLITVFDSPQIPRILVPHLHNDVLQFAVSFGVFGVIAYLIALTAPIAAWTRSSAREFGYGSYWVISVALSYAAMGLTNTNFVYEPPKVMFCFAAAVAAALAGGRRRTP